MDKISEKIGLEVPPYTFEIEKGKIKELAVAIGDLKDEYLNGNLIPPTFPTVIEFRGSEFSFPDFLGIDNAKVLHGEQEYEYLGKMSVGDTINVKCVIEDAYVKAGKNFYVIKREFFNKLGELVLRSRTTIIEIV